MKTEECSVCRKLKVTGYHPEIPTRQRCNCVDEASVGPIINMGFAVDAAEDVLSTISSGNDASWSGGGGEFSGAGASGDWGGSSDSSSSDSGGSDSGGSSD